MPRNYEVIVVGAGPAGSTVAYELATKGIKVLVLDRSIFPRYKCCAGGLTVRAASLLGRYIDDVVEDTISSTTVTFAGSSPYHGTCDQSILYTVMRDKLDHALLNRAIQAGADVLQGIKAVGIHLNETGIEVTTTAGNFRSKLLAGADGAQSTVAKAIGVNNNNKSITAIETELAVSDTELAKWKSQIAIGLGYVPHGYAWLFPKSDHLSIGIACLKSKIVKLKVAYQEFLNSFGFKRSVVIKSSGGSLPVCTGRSIVTQGRVALLGDAAGLADPLTGEGICNAIHSAKLAVPVFEKSLESGDFNLRDYGVSVTDKILAEMKLAYTFSNIFRLFPDRLFQLLKRDNRVWKGYCYLLRGDINYSTIKDKVSTLGGLYHLLF